MLPPTRLARGPLNFRPTRLGAYPRIKDNCSLSNDNDYNQQYNILVVNALYYILVIMAGWVDL